MTKEKFAGKMRYFWTKHWYYQDIDFWARIITDKLCIEVKENHIVALSIMASRKPKKFKDVK